MIIVEGSFRASGPSEATVTGDSDEAHGPSEATMTGDSDQAHELPLPTGDRDRAPQPARPPGYYAPPLTGRLTVSGVAASLSRSHTRDLSLSLRLSLSLSLSLAG